MSRAAQPNTGSTTTRAPSSVVPTISWPGTNGKLTIGSKYRDDFPATVARSEPQIPARIGWTRCHPGPGSVGSGASTRASGPTRAPPPGVTEPATRAAANRGSDRENRSAFTPTSHSGVLHRGHGAVKNASLRGSRAGPHGQQGAGAAGGFRPVLHVPA